MSLLSLWFIACLLTETLTELAVKSQIFLPIRTSLSNLGSFFNKVLNCGYCFSVWAAFLVVWILDFPPSFSGHGLVDYFVWSLIVHRASNFIHNFNDKHLDKFYSTMHVSSVKDHE